MAKEVEKKEKMLDDVQNKKFGLSITNIVSLVTVLSGLIAGWYTFTGRIDSLEEVVQGFAETSDIELVGQKLEDFEKSIDYLNDIVKKRKAKKEKRKNKAKTLKKRHEPENTNSTSISPQIKVETSVVNKENISYSAFSYNIICIKKNRFISAHFLSIIFSPHITDIIH